MTFSIDAASENTGQAGPKAAPAEEERALMIRDRLLLYIRGLEVGPELSLELALEAVRRTASLPGEHRSAAGAMEALREILAERGLDPEGKNCDGPYLSSTPRLHRGSMIAEELDISPLRRLLYGLLRRLTGSRPGSSDGSR